MNNFKKEEIWRLGQSVFYVLLFDDGYDVEFDFESTQCNDCINMYLL